MAEFDLVNADPTMLPVYCLGMDMPAILDHDDDGDLDIISFSDNSSTLNRFQGQTACGLDLKCTNLCYGKIAEASENNTLFIGEAFTEDQCGFQCGKSGNGARVQCGKNWRACRRRHHFTSTRTQRTQRPHFK